jgi:hypothetical protein
MAASTLMILNIAPRWTNTICTVLYLSFVATLQVFASYQSDGMLLEAGFLTFFFAPGGLRPGLGEDDPPSRASRFLLLFLCFRIYFESGAAKMLSGDIHWRRFTAMDDYYQNGPLPTWIGWYAQQLPHAWHAFCSGFTLAAELGLVWLFFLPRRARIACFWILFPFQSAIILTANYAFINHITLALSILLLDDRHIRYIQHLLIIGKPHPPPTAVPPLPMGEGTDSPLLSGEGLGVRLVSGFFLGWVFYANTALLLRMIVPRLPLPLAPAVALEPFRFVNRFGLFAVMTPARYEIEFQGTPDGKTWIPYPFKYKPQDIKEAPRIYAPYQPRFDWNLWFASLEPWRQNTWVVRVEQLLLENEPSVIRLFRSNPFAGNPPKAVRAMVWQYWFTDLPTKHREGTWWRRRILDLYAPALVRRPDGKFAMMTMPQS